MAKGQKRSNRELKKPEAVEKPAPVVASPFQPGAAEAAGASPRREITDLPFGWRGTPVPFPR
jgi:hypothetical protein